MIAELKTHLVVPRTYYKPGSKAWGPRASMGDVSSKALDSIGVEEMPCNKHDEACLAPGADIDRQSGLLDRRSSIAGPIRSSSC